MNRFYPLESFMKLLFALFMSFFTLLYASVIGSVEKVEGSVKVKSEGSIKKSDVAAGYEMKNGDLISTSKGSSAILKLLDGSNVVLEESSTIFFDSAVNAEQKEGKIFYKITSRDAKNALKVTTPFAIIGIKGTTFIINADENNSNVKLKEGLIGVASIKEEFELYRKQVEEEFNKFMKEQQAGFEEYKKAQFEGVAEMTKEFDLQAGNTITFAGQKVQESGWSEKDDAEFKHFESLIGSVK